MKTLKSKILSSLFLLSSATIATGSCQKSGLEKKDTIQYNELLHSSSAELSQEKIHNKNSTINQYLHKNDSVIPDYSGRGTVITRPIDSAACADEITGPTKINSNLAIPAYYGKYKVSNWWDWTFDSSSWTDWSPNNKRSNPNYYNYRGPEALEYQVEERQEYRYCRDVLKTRYKTKYITWFRGSKWWNRLIVYYVSNDYCYQPAPENFEVFNRYTTLVYDGNYWQTEYDYSWRTNATGLGFFGARYRTWDSRTSYRFRTRRTEWDEYGFKSWEYIPLYHSLYSTDGIPIKHGIMLDSNTDLNQTFVSSDESSKSYFYKTKCFYIPTSMISEKIIHDIVMNHTDSDQISSDIYSAIISSDFSLGVIFEILSKKYSKISVFKSLSKLSLYFTLISLFLNIADYQSKENKKFEIESFKNVLEFIDDYNLLSISYSCFTPSGIPFISMIPKHALSAKLVDNKHSSSDDVDYISLDFMENKTADCGNYIPYYEYNDCKSYYGTISYMEDFSRLYETAETYFTSFDIFDFTTWFN